MLLEQALHLHVRQLPAATCYSIFDTKTVRLRSVTAAVSHVIVHLL